MFETREQVQQFIDLMRPAWSPLEIARFVFASLPTSIQYPAAEIVPPTSGRTETGAVIRAADGTLWLCLTAGNPGVWINNTELSETYFQGIYAEPVDTVALLKAVTEYEDKQRRFVKAKDAEYYYYSDSTATPDDDSVIKPNDITLPAAGRWLRETEPPAAHAATHASGMSDAVALAASQITTSGAVTNNFLKSDANGHPVDAAANVNSFAPIAHVGSNGVAQHALVDNANAGFMSTADKNAADSVNAVNGLVKGDGNAVFSAAIANVDFLIPVAGATANNIAALDANGVVVDAGYGVEKFIENAAGAVLTTHLVDNAVETAKIADGNVTFVKLGADVNAAFDSNGAASGAVSAHNVASIHVNADITDALAGTSGTPPSASNHLVDNADTRLSDMRIPADNSVTYEKLAPSAIAAFDSNTAVSNHNVASIHVNADVTDALAGTSGTAISGTNKLVDNADSRLSDARTPLAHALVDNANHTTSGLTPGHVLTAISANTVGFVEAASVYTNAMAIAAVNAATNTFTGSIVQDNTIPAAKIIGGVGAGSVGAIGAIQMAAAGNTFAVSILSQNTAANSVVASGSLGITATLSSIGGNDKASSVYANAVVMTNGVSSVPLGLNIPANVRIISCEIIVSHTVALTAGGTGGLTAAYTGGLNATIATGVNPGVNSTVNSFVGGITTAVSDITITAENTTFSGSLGTVTAVVYYEVLSALNTYTPDPVSPPYYLKDGTKISPTPTDLGSPLGVAPSTDGLYAYVSYHYSPSGGWENIYTYAINGTTGGLGSALSGPFQATNAGTTHMYWKEFVHSSTSGRYLLGTGNGIASLITIDSATRYPTGTRNQITLSYTDFNYAFPSYDGNYLIYLGKSGGVRNIATVSVGDINTVVSQITLPNDTGDNWGDVTKDGAYIVVRNGWTYLTYSISGVGVLTYKSQTNMIGEASYGIAVVGTGAVWGGTYSNYGGSSNIFTFPKATIDGSGNLSAFSACIAPSWSWARSDGAHTIHANIDASGTAIYLEDEDNQAMKTYNTDGTIKGSYGPATSPVYPTGGSYGQSTTHANSGNKFIYFRAGTLSASPPTSYMIYDGGATPPTQYTKHTRVFDYIEFSADNSVQNTAFTTNAVTNNFIANNVISGAKITDNTIPSTKIIGGVGGSTSITTISANYVANVTDTYIVANTMASNVTVTMWAAAGNSSKTTSIANMGPNVCSINSVAGETFAGTASPVTIVANGASLGITSDNVNFQVFSSFPGF